MPQKPSPKCLSKFFSTDKQISGNFCKTEADYKHADCNHNKYTRTHVYARVRTYRTHVYARIARTCTHACVRKPLCAIYLQLTVFPFKNNAFMHRCNKSRKISFLPR